ncbi:putative selenium-dependent hydroxylase accessory protein YqeC [Kipferlia bialata]|uniref:Selenium-dependent hydroxylase accessory protein YqeC n=1 Tax=Kipferlia bialata TaxID=797122 RepID=A0A391NZG1_9EUKA|nr:putative selenium-dependent hydroxylase accessory protein YqeC [Kipferlia bialata]|eukprot:g11649.t1
MDIATLLHIVPGDVVSLVGGGGKTSVLYSLATALRQRYPSTPILVSTTTHMSQEQVSLFTEPKPGTPDQSTICHLDVDITDMASVQQQLITATVETPPCLLVTAQTGTPRVNYKGVKKRSGLPVSLIDSLVSDRTLKGWIVLVEADGARTRPLKCPKEGEPQVPTCCTLLVPVVGLDCLGHPIESAYVHRPERVAALVNNYYTEGDMPERVTGESLVTGAIVSVVASSRNGLLKGVPPGGCRVSVVLNKVKEDQTRVAEEVALRILSEIKKGGNGFDSSVVVAGYTEPSVLAPIQCIGKYPNNE